MRRLHTLVFALLLFGVSLTFIYPILRRQLCYLFLIYAGSLFLHVPPSSMVPNPLNARFPMFLMPVISGVVGFLDWQLLFCVMPVKPDSIYIVPNVLVVE